MAASRSRTSRSRQFRLSDTLRLSGLAGTEGATGTITFTTGEEYTTLFLVFTSNVPTTIQLADHKIVVQFEFVDAEGQRREFYHGTFQNPALGRIIERKIEAPAPTGGMIGRIDVTVSQLGSSLQLDEMVATMGYLADPPRAGIELGEFLDYLRG